MPATAPAAAAYPERISNERSLSRWAHAAAPARALAEPHAGARTVARLRYTTEDDRPEVYLALKRTYDSEGKEWIQVRLPMRPNGRSGWVRRWALGPFHVVRTQLRINRRTLRVTLHRDGRKVWSARIGVGKRSTPTPGGRFYIRERIDGYGLGTIYGPLAFGTSAYSSLSDWPRGGVVGIHGTNRPGLIPGRPSHGCVRLRNRDILRLGRLMPIGTPVHIL